MSSSKRDNIVTIKREWNRSASFRLTQWLKTIPHMIRSYYRCCCINEPVIFSHCVHFKLGHRFHALMRVCSDRDDTVPLMIWQNIAHLHVNVHVMNKCEINMLILSRKGAYTIWMFVRSIFHYLSGTFIDHFTQHPEIFVRLYAYWSYTYM